MVISIIAVLLAVGVPAIENWRENRLVTEASDRLNNDIHQALSQASTAVATPVMTGTPPAKTTNGYIVFKNGAVIESVAFDSSIKFTLPTNFTSSAGITGYTTGCAVVFFDGNGSVVGGIPVNSNDTLPNVNNQYGGGQIGLNNAAVGQLVQVSHLGHVTELAATPAQAQSPANEPASGGW